MQAKISRLSSSVLLMACSLRGFKRKTVNTTGTYILQVSKRCIAIPVPMWSVTRWCALAGDHQQPRCLLWQKGSVFFFPPSFLRLYKTSQVPQERKHAGVECSSARFQHLLPNGLCGVFHKRCETTGCRRDRGVTRDFYGLLLEQDLQHCCP